MSFSENMQKWYNSPEGQAYVAAEEAHDAEIDSLLHEDFKGLKFRMTCGACPEQYDVYDGKGQQVAYVRLRWGCLRVDHGDCGGPTIYRHDFGDGYKGSFDTHEERLKFLREIAKTIKGCQREERQKRKGN